MDLLRAASNHWSRFPITCVEDVQQAVLGAGLDAMQLSRGRVGGSLVFANDDAAAVSSGYVNGRVCLTGLLSERMTTLGLGLRLPQGSRQWMNEVGTGDIGVFRPGDEHEALYMPGSIYVAVTLPDDALEARAAELDLVLDQKQLGGSRISRQPLLSDSLTALQAKFERIHMGIDLARASELCRFVLECLIRHLAREPQPRSRYQARGGHHRIVARAKQFILNNLDQPLAISAIARAAFASRSALFRAFHEVLDEAPQSFVRKVRLHRIRRDLATEAETRCTIALLANTWGIGEAGRFAGWYRELFDELPSETRAHRQLVQQEVVSPHSLGRTA